MKKPLNSIYDLDWGPRLIIEASAGTGKTYTIVGLFVRLLIEKKLDIDQVLVMTFTKKATSELRERIFERLRQCADHLEGREKKDDNFLNDFAGQVEDREDALKRLRNAIRNFDEAQVFTIHGFCQKVLSEHALLSGMPFEVEVTQHDDMLRQAAEDYWRVFMSENGQTDAGKYLINKLLGIADTPKKLLKKLYDLFEKPYAEIEGEGLDDPVQYLEEVIDKRREMVAMWEEEKDVITKELMACELKHYTEKNVLSRVSSMDQFLDDDHFTADDFDQLKYFVTDHVHDENNLKKGKTRLPSHPFFHKSQEYFNLISDINQAETSLIRQVYEDVKSRRDKLSKQSGRVTYNDLLIKLEGALTDDKKGKALSEALLKKYPYALVDEFQDTDPIQYSIFDSIYPRNGDGSGLMMIGDPKQAIYGFRGADIYTYFRAKKDGSGDLYTLNKNYRSRPSLIQAVNKLFDGDRQPFIEDEIEYFGSEAGKKELENDFIVDEKAPSPLKILTRRGIQTTKDSSREFAYNQTVKEVADLLEKAEAGRALIDGKKLMAGDIAILVSSHKDAEEIKRRLKRVGVDAVTYSNQKVFETFEAKRLHLVMEAVLQPLDRRKLNNVLLSGFFGLGLDKLHQIKENEELRQELTEELQQLRETWQKKGFYPMFRSLLFKNERLSELAELDNSERVITNLYHLADICSKAEQAGGLDPQALYTWYVKELTDPDKDEEKTLLLESDQNLVKISTIHNSKGLEFPVVFCPTLWEGREQKDEDLMQQYHTSLEGSLTINIDQAGGDEREKAFHKSAVEGIAEEVRKFYVAATRAKYQCTIIWDTHDTSNFSGLGSSLIGGHLVKESINKNYKVKNDAEITDQTFLDRFQSLVDNSDGAIEFRILDVPELRTEKVKWSDRGRTSLMVKNYSGRPELPVQRKLESFSSLVHGKEEAAEPDYDQEMENYVKALTTDLAQKQKSTIFNFPRGATPGTAIHKLFEHDDFDFNTVQTDDLTGAIEEVLDEFGIDLKWVDVMKKMLKDVTRSSIPNLDLENVERQDQIREMEFNFPVREPLADRLFEIIRNQKPTAGQTSDMKSMMTGFIDLIVRQNGKYFILDYKSNYLGDEPEDYAPDRLKEEIEGAGYDLQYHLYTVALIKYLRKRIPGFDYETQFGGAVYLFVRGMRAGSPNGIWFHKPDLEVIEKLENELKYLGSPNRGRKM